ncbi:hypothetical protein BVY01_00120 [bacterium I07]|nr:hypothetical protein BVY01_00120 [bacterium I07]
MNIVSITGKLVRNAILNGSGEKRAMKFTVAAPCGFNPKTKKEIVGFTPCVLFNPKDELQTVMTSDGQGKLVALNGNIMTSSYNNKEGKKVWATEVRVDPRGFRLLSDGAVNSSEVVSENISSQLSP